MNAGAVLNGIGSIRSILQDDAYGLEIPLGGRTNLKALVSPRDYPTVSALTWHIHARPDEHQYASHVFFSRKLGVKNRRVLMHRFILGEDGPIIDHVNGDGLDNRRVNLRFATVAQNLANSGKRRNGRTSRFKGVHRHHRDKKWRAQIFINGKIVHLGSFSNEEDAARAYDAVHRASAGEFARCNFPESR